MNPTISKISEHNDVYRFTLAGVNVSCANAIRRIMMSEIPVNVIYTETYQDNQCNIQINKTRLHNEFIKQRLSSIPIHQTDLNVLPNNHILEVDLTNDTDNIIYVTTEHFKIRNKTNGKFISQDEVRKFFPPCKMTNSYIDFVRLRPKISDSIPGEQLKLTAEFSISMARKNSMFTVVSKCAYFNTPDDDKIKAQIIKLEKDLRDKDVPEDDIKFQRRNFEFLDSQRYFIDNSFDFVIQSVGTYENQAIVKMACIVLTQKFKTLIDEIDENSVEIYNSETTLDYCFDITLKNEDYTMGKVLEYFIYETYYMGDKTLTYCGFKKMHPHDSDSIIRIAFEKNSAKDECKKCLRFACSEALELFTKIGKKF